MAMFIDHEAEAESWLGTGWGCPPPPELCGIPHMQALPLERSPLCIYPELTVQPFPLECKLL